VVAAWGFPPRDRSPLFVPALPFPWGATATEHSRDASLACGNEAQPAGRGLRA
jgi:hypothetical protein